MSRKAQLANWRHKAAEFRREAERLHALLETLQNNAGASKAELIRPIREQDQTIGDLRAGMERSHQIFEGLCAALDREQVENTDFRDTLEKIRQRLDLEVA